VSGRASLPGGRAVHRLDAFVVTAPGLEELALAEVVKLGAKPASATHGGVHCTLTWPQLWSLHLRARVATRVLVRVARFKADGFDTLRIGLDRVDWDAWLPDASTPAGRVRVTASADGKSGLFHTGAIAERVAAAIGRETVTTPVPPAADEAGVEPVQPDVDLFAESDAAAHVLVRVVRDVVTVSIDATGAALHRRGWRGPAGRAPMRETLAAALVLASGWDVRTPLVDPFCGSGTVAIEAAMIARRMSPGRHRSFAFQEWPSFDAEAFGRVLRGCDADVIERCPPILGSDRDAGVIEACAENALRAGVAGDVQFDRRPVSALELPSRRGSIVTNPPYGHRVGGDVRDLYDAWGKVLAAPAAGGWRLALIAMRETPVSRLRVPLEQVLRTTNGGLDVAISAGVVPVR
jgi:putative N6-adenine-specific DNA methylase